MSNQKRAPTYIARSSTLEILSALFRYRDHGFAVSHGAEGYSSLFPSAVKDPALVGDPGEVERKEKSKK